MIRLVTLTIAAVVVFVGFGIPFLVPDRWGLVAGIGTVAFGATVFWFTESRTKNSLHANTLWNRLLKVDGEWKIKDAPIK